MSFSKRSRLYYKVPVVVVSVVERLIGAVDHPDHKKIIASMLNLMVLMPVGQVNYTFFSKYLDFYKEF